MVDKDRRPAFDGTYQRQRFYRNAAWMNITGFGANQKLTSSARI